jgi:hypothetical protein
MRLNKRHHRAGYLPMIDKTRRHLTPSLVLIMITLLASACSAGSSPPAAATPPQVDTEPIPTPSPQSGWFTQTPGPAPSAKTDGLPLAPSLMARLAGGTASQDDLLLIEAHREGRYHAIKGLLLNTLQSGEDSPVIPPGAPGYVLVDPDTGEERIAAWIETGTGQVYEYPSGYPLNVRSDPGQGSEILPGGEQVYRYGFAWYPRWERVLPEPVIRLIDDFYSTGVEHVHGSLDSYQAVSATGFGGDLSLVTWDEQLPEIMLRWGTDLPAPPFFALPDSGSVDVSDARFQEALTGDLVRIDEASIARYLSSSYPKQSWYDPDQTGEEIIEKLTSPFRSPGRFSDLEKAVILGAIFDERGPLTITIDFDLEGGYFVPDSGEKELRIAPREVDLMFGYEGIYLSKFPHEMAHVIEARDYPFIDEQCWPHEAHMKETLKYLMEFMWWVQQYPGDAPSWDWEYINSGLTLARLLSGYFPNSSC